MDMRLDKAKLKALRESRAWSQTHLAEVSGISLRTIQRIEKSGNASLESIKSICATFDVHVEYLTVPQEQQSKIESSLLQTMRKKLLSIEAKITLASFIVAFTIAFLFTVWR